jgi:hypothetical protein
MKSKNKWVLLVGGLVAAATTLLLINSRQKTEGKPSKKAPQLDIDNPGSQDDFPKPPMESEVG